MNFTISQYFFHYHPLAYIATPHCSPMYFPSLEGKELGWRSYHATSDCPISNTGWRTKCHTIDCAHNTFLLLQKHL